MASVQELIAAAEAEKNPGISAMEGLARGYLVGQQQQLERAKTLVLLEQNRREQEQQMESQRRLNAQYAADMENNRKRSLMEAAKKPDTVVTGQRIGEIADEQKKVVRKYGHDAKGNLTMDETVTIGRDDENKLELRQAQLEAVRARTDAIRDGREAKAQDVLGKKTQLLSKRIEDLGIPEAITQLNTIARLIPKSGDVPGYGRVASLVPSMVAGDDARALRQAVQALQNVKIKDRSGAAVTPPEFVRLGEEFGTGRFKTESQLRQGLNQAVAAYRERTRNLFAGFDEDTKAEYLSRENIASPLDVLSSFDFSYGGGSRGGAAGANPAAAQNTAPSKKAVGQWNQKTGRVEVF